jgi:exo-beta-1,3-glucanase (GH17 family)
VRRILFIIAVTAELLGSAAASPIADALTGNRWIAYAPTHYYPAESPPVVPGRESLRADLTVLRGAGFRGLITYGADIPAIADVTQEMGFRAMLLGIWDPFNPTERAKALRTVAAHKQLIAGIVVGNEGLTTGRYTIERLCVAMSEIRAVARKPVSTTEPVDFTLSEPRIGACSDFITANAHPYFSNQKEPQAAVRWTQDAWDAVCARYAGKPVLLKEVGLPTAGDEAVSEKAQEEYYTLLAKTAVKFAYFEAFDASPRFKQGSIEDSWGLWHNDRSPKPVVHALPWRKGNR